MTRFLSSRRREDTFPCSSVVDICARARIFITVIPSLALFGYGGYLFWLLLLSNALEWQTLWFPCVLVVPGALIFCLGLLGWLSCCTELKFWILIHFIMFTFDAIALFLVAWVCYQNISSTHLDLCESWHSFPNSTRLQIEQDFACCGCPPIGNISAKQFVIATACQVRSNSTVDDVVLPSCGVEVDSLLKRRCL